MDPSASELKDESLDFKAKVTQWISKHLTKDNDGEEQPTNSAEKELDKFTSRERNDCSQCIPDSTDQPSNAVETNSKTTSKETPAAMTDESAQRNMGNFFDILKRQTVAELGEHEPTCRLHWTRQSFYHKTGSDNFSQPSRRDKAFKCTCSRGNRNKTTNPSPSTRNGDHRDNGTDEDSHGGETGNMECEDGVNGGEKSSYGRKDKGKGKWWSCKRLKKRTKPNATKIAQEDANSGRKDKTITESKQRRPEPETEFEDISKTDNGGQNKQKSSIEIVTSTVQTHASWIRQNPGDVTLKVPRPLCIAGNKKSHKMKKPQIIDDLFISKITVGDELNFLRRDLALGWLTRQEARDRLQDVKRRFNVDLTLSLTNREFQQVFGCSDDESEVWEWHPIGPWSTDV